MLIREEFYLLSSIHSSAVHFALRVSKTEVVQEQCSSRAPSELSKWFLLYLSAKSAKEVAYHTVPEGAYGLGIFIPLVFGCNIPYIIN